MNDNTTKFKKYNSGPGSDNNNFAIEYKKQISNFFKLLKQNL